ncbi:hypothetical protein Ctob_005197 [Chrysochromulina tobinii]|uniref:Protein transport protein SEC23 n=1 Tax=Chrysochromulina tobinii TaxID=1460289 RepID=A0A0M0JA86_9EUKA|nr:hypothetical protein Ctob_005197 [Chrysochromulina tobinii]|eukprot:KOO23410.1 hypothetical protein Ctob_005197 [Chrysochromulina sp. CCMP291]
MLAASVVVFFLVDETCDEGALRDLLVAARDALPLLPPDALVGLLSFGRAVSVYLLAQPASAADESSVESSPIEALTLPASDAPLPWELEALNARAAHALAPRHACYTRLLRALEALQPPPPPPTFARRPAHGSSASTTSAVSSAEPARGLLAAIDIAYALLWEAPKTASKTHVPSVVPSSTDRAAELSAVLSALDVEASALLSARLAAVEACNLEKSERTGNALARAVVARAKALAARYGVPRLRVHEGWLWNSTTVLGYDVAEAPLPELLRRLHEVALGPAAVRTGRGRAQDGAQEHVTAVDVAVDIDAVHAARIGLLTLPAKEAARHAAPLDLDGREAEDEEAVEHDADVERWCEALKIFGMREPAPG